MPLIKGKSKKAFEHNMKAEMEAGKPKAQSLAIAYSVARHAKKMSKGGMVETQAVSPALSNLKEFTEEHPEYEHAQVPSDVEHELNAIRSARKEVEGYSEGGEVEDDSEDLDVMGSDEDFLSEPEPYKPRLLMARMRRGRP